MPRILIQPTERGQVTLPKAIRQKLKLSADTFLDVTIVGKNIVLKPIRIVEEANDELRVYTDEQISEFIKEDIVSRENALFANKLLDTDKY